jgi:hypothetical protein
MGSDADLPAWKRIEMLKKTWQEILNEKEHFIELGVDRCIILKLTLNNYHGSLQTGFI